jgi:YHS domain-containing protein
MGAVLDLILFLVTLRAIWRLFGGMVVGLKSQPPSVRAPEHGIQMARDPVCGTFVVPDRAVTIVDGRQHVYFCSTKCRDQYRARTA